MIDVNIPIDDESCAHHGSPNFKTRKSEKLALSPKRYDWKVSNSVNIHPVYEVLSKVGLEQLSDMEKVDSWQEETYRKLHQNLYSALMPRKLAAVDGKEGILDPFKFVASASMRAEAGCTEPMCRYRKLDFLARYAALYATSIVLPITLPSPEDNDEFSYVKPRVQQALFTLLTCRLVINSERFIPTLMRTSHHCEHELAFVAQTREVIGDYMEYALKDFAKDFEVRYQRPDKSPSGLPTIYIEGPDTFLEHGEIVFRQLDGVEPKLSSRRKFDTDGMIHIRGKQKHPFLWPIFREIASNSSFYLAYKMHDDVRLLTDLPGEAIFLRELSESTEFVSNTSGLQAIAHSLPLLSDMSVETLLAIRDEEREAFEAYRVTIREMSNTVMSRGMSKEEGFDYFASQIAPSLKDLKREIALERKRQTMRTAVGVASLAAGVGIGAFAGLPLLASVPIAALGTGIGGKLLTKAVESKCEHGADLRQKNDLFFLMRLIEDDKHRPH